MTKQSLKLTWDLLKERILAGGEINEEDVYERQKLFKEMWGL